MIVFKCYMKILRQNVTLVIIYLGIFFSVALVMQMAAGKSEDSLYANTSIDIGVVKEDQGVLAQGFVDYLNTIHNVIPMKNNPEVLQENLFYRNVEYIVQIPDDFYEACIQGSQPLKVTKVSSVSASSDLVPYTYYFRYIPYLFLGALCYTMGYILMAFKKGDIQKRMEASAISVRRQSLQGLLAMGVIGAILWLLGILGVVLMYGNTFLNSELCGYYIANTLLMLVVSLSLSYLIGMFIPNSNILSGVANIVSLSMCFLCGVFVPMDVMDKSVLKVAQFLPVYWYEQVNEILSRHHSLTPELLGKVRISMGIEVLFAAMFMCLILVVSRYRKEG